MAIGTIDISFTTDSRREREAHEDGEARDELALHYAVLNPLSIHREDHAARRVRMARCRRGRGRRA